MALPAVEIQRMMKAAAWHAEITGDEGSMRDYLETFYPHASAYQRSRALALATQAIGVGLAIRELAPDTPLWVALHGERRPAQDVGVRVRVDMRAALDSMGIAHGKGVDPPHSGYATIYLRAQWDDPARVLGQLVREAMMAKGYTAEQVSLMKFEAVGPTLFPIT